MIVVRVPKIVWSTAFYHVIGLVLNRRRYRIVKPRSFLCKGFGSEVSKGDLIGFRLGPFVSLPLHCEEISW